MAVTSSPAHIACRVCRAEPQAAFAHLASAAGMAQWCLGLLQTREVEPGLYTGVSQFDGATGWVRVDADPATGSVDYSVGATRDRLVRRIGARVSAGPTLGYAPDECLVTLLAWRPRDMSDERWARLVATHETEIELIRAQLEAGAEARR